jgi:hypothetical protein
VSIAIGQEMNMQLARRSLECSRWFSGVLAVLLVTSTLSSAQGNHGAARLEDVASPSAIVLASYVAISGPPGQVLNLDRFRSLFLPQAQLVSVNTKDGQGSARTMTLQEFANMVTARIGKEGHVEHEIAERVEVYGNIANVWSTYESRKTRDDPQVTRGINSIQLMNDGKRWWITGAQWQHETAETPIPGQYLSGAH